MISELRVSLSLRLKIFTIVRAYYYFERHILKGHLKKITHMIAELSLIIRSSGKSFFLSNARALARFDHSFSGDDDSVSTV